MTLNLDDALDAELPRFCGECGTDLPERGAQCAACGWLPVVTRAELAETLSVPGTLAEIEAGRLVAEGERLREEAAARFLAAQRVLAAAAAETERDTAQLALDAALSELEHAEVALGEADRVASAAGAQFDEALQKKLAESRRRAGKDAEATPIAVNGTVYPPNAQAIPGAVYSPGTPFPR
jgi:hypothetical protein